MFSSHYIVLYVLLFQSQLFWGNFFKTFSVFFKETKMFIHWYGDVTISGEGLQILTFTRYSWPLNSEGSLACHTYCDTGHPFKLVISEDLWHLHLLPSV